MKSKLILKTLSFFKYLFFFLIFLFHSYSMAIGIPPGLNAIENLLAENLNSIDIFSQFVNKQLKNPFIKHSPQFKNKFNEKWKKSVIENTQSWSQLDALYFLEFLRNRKIGNKYILKIVLNDLPHLKGVDYLDFTRTISFYEEYIGSKEVNSLLRKSLSEFHILKSRQISQKIKPTMNL